MPTPDGEPIEAHDYARVSTGSLPSAEQVQQLVDDAYERFRPDATGENSNVYPALAEASPGLFGVCIAGVGGQVFKAGDVTTAFTIMSVAKPFVFALVCKTIGPREAQRRIGVNATGRAFNSLEAIERSPDGRTNPMVNAGAIATTSLVPGATADEQWARLHEALCSFAGRQLELDEHVLASARATNHRNQAIARLLQAQDRLACDPEDAVDVYTKQSCLRVTVEDLAVMGATLAAGGTNPRTGQHVVDVETSHDTLAVMATAGLYETSGDWLYRVGLPGKSGIGGGIVTVSPGKGGLGTFSPPLDTHGNSVRGQRASEYLSRSLGLDLFASAPPGS